MGRLHYGRLRTCCFLIKEPIAAIISSYFPRRMLAAVSLRERRGLISLRVNPILKHLPCRPRLLIKEARPPPPTLLCIDLWCLFFLLLLAVSSLSVPTCPLGGGGDLYRIHGFCTYKVRKSSTRLKKSVVLCLPPEKINATLQGWPWHFNSRMWLHCLNRMLE